MTGHIEVVARASRHGFAKRVEAEIQLFAGLGVGGDAHAGATVRHRYDRRRNPDAPNLRQVHLIAAEQIAELVAAGFAVEPGSLGENVTSRGLPLTDLPCGTRLHLGPEAIVELTGLRTPCVLIDRHQPGLMQATRELDGAGRPFLKGGVMAIVLAGGTVRPGDAITVTLPAEPHLRLAPV
jgi:MOSC domain-containing protein YiiM